MAHMAGNEPNFDISSKKYDVKKSVPQKCKTAWALGLKQLPYPSKIASFSRNLNREALLKVSFKNIDWFQKYKALKWKIVF